MKVAGATTHDLPLASVTSTVTVKVMPGFNAAGAKCGTHDTRIRNTTDQIELRHSAPFGRRDITLELSGDANGRRTADRVEGHGR
jgi:hypothetical protein